MKWIARILLATCVVLILAILASDASCNGNAVKNGTIGSSGSISGHVYQADGKTPIAGATIWIEGQVTDGVQHVTTSTDGYYHFGDVRIDQVYLMAGGYAFVMSPSRAVVVNKQQHVSGIDFVLEQGGIISGYIYQPDGITPIPGAKVNIEQWEGDKTRFPIFGGPVTPTPFTVETAADGSYAIGGLLTGGYRLSAVAGGYPETFFNSGDYQGDVRLISVVKGETTRDIGIVMIASGP